MTKAFSLRTLLTVTTGRLLTEPQGERDNGIGRLYEILGWMTDDSPMTHQLGRFGAECKPWLLKWFPELKECGSDKALGHLDNLMKDRDPQRGINDWIKYLTSNVHGLSDTYDVPKVPKGQHVVKSPIGELQEMLGGNSKKIIAVSI